MLSNDCVISLEKANMRRAYNRAYYKFEKKEELPLKRLRLYMSKCLGLIQSLTVYFKKQKWVIPE